VAIIRRALIGGAGLAFALTTFGPAVPAFADPAVPTDYQSVIDSVDPAPSGVAVAVVGGDSFMQVKADPGHDVVIMGYYDEQYARITKSGDVEINTASPTVLQNTQRYGVALKEDADPNKPPVWTKTGRHGELIWHDHRTHWMAKGLATVKDDRGLVQKWEVPLIVDGVPATVRGSLYRHPEPGMAWWLLVIPGLVGAFMLKRFRAPMVMALGAIIAVSGLVDRLSLPSDARPQWGAVILGAVAALTAGAALRRSAWWASAVLAGSGAALLIAGYLQRTAVARAFVPGPTPDWLVRSSTVLALGVGLVVLVTGVMATVGFRLDLLFGKPAQPIASGS
jgi:hypothetical protein